MQSSNHDMKLIDVIEEVSKKAYKSKKEQAENSKLLCSFFDKYYGGNKNKKEKEVIANRLDVSSVTIEHLTEMKDDFSRNVSEGVQSYPLDKYKLSFRLEALFKHLIRKYKINISSDIFQNFKTRDRNERLLKILKYLHDKEKDRAEIAEDFGISERTLSEDLKELLDGFNFMGTSMRITQLNRAKNTYRSMIHPIFLAMNTSEIYALTVGLKLLSHGTVFQGPLNEIADKIYQQLSSYAKSMIDQHRDKEFVIFKEGDRHFVNTYELMQREYLAFCYFLKEPLPCEVTYHHDGQFIKKTGILKLVNPGGERCELDKVIIETDCEAFEVDLKDMVKIQKISTI